MTNRRPESEIAHYDDLATNLPGDALRNKSSEIREVFLVRVFVAKVLGVHNTERAWRRGADGEEVVARQLGKLGVGWRVLQLLQPRPSPLGHCAAHPVISSLRHARRDSRATTGHAVSSVRGESDSLPSPAAAGADGPRSCADQSADQGRVR